MTGIDRKEGGGVTAELRSSAFGVWCLLFLVQIVVAAPELTFLLCKWME